jgi:hypothetical protein
VSKPDGLSSGTPAPRSGPHNDPALTSRHPLRSRATGSSKRTVERGRTPVSYEHSMRVTGSPAAPSVP